MSFQSVYAQTWDVVVWGAGYAGFGAALALRRQGLAVLLVERSAVLLPESGWAFAANTGESATCEWREWNTLLAQIGGIAGGQYDGAIAQVMAHRHCRQQGIPVLFYVVPVAPAVRDGLLEGMDLRGKSGFHRLRARQWIDATESGELAVLLDAAWEAPTPQRKLISIFGRFPKTRSLAESDFTSAELPEARLSFAPSGWEQEERLLIDLPGSVARPRAAWMPALRAWHAAQDLSDSLITHGSLVPFHVYSGEMRPPSMPANVLACAPALAPLQSQTFAGRFEQGLEAAHLLAERPNATVVTQEDSVPEDAVWNSVQTVRQSDIVVAGLGTGGALAAIAAGRRGARMVAFDALPFAGGIGAGAGIHYYYLGVRGGLQAELDSRVREAMSLFGAARQVRGFHPDAKKIVLESMLEECGVEFQYETTLMSVDRHEGRVREALLSSPEGLRRVSASIWVDATGDGDLAASAGGRYWLGRCGDGLLHAYSQSSGRVVWKDELPALQMVNFDAGYCDATDEEDLTRARREGLAHYEQENYDSVARPIYIAPALGVRQGRQFETDYVLPLEDLIERRHFSDAVGYTAGHYDNHARDFEWETDEAMFWVWVCRQFVGNLACEIPYRMLLPRNVENVILACRAVGVTEEAHHSFRMQRDIQRIGEVAGLAASLAIENKCALRDIPYPELRAGLAASGALKLEELPHQGFGDEVSPRYFQTQKDSVEKWLGELQDEPPTAAMWHLYRAGEAARQPLLQVLHSDHPTHSWRAAAILAMLGDSRAEERLCQAILQREIGEKAHEIARDFEAFWCFVPRWYAAVLLLKRCGSAQCLDALESVANDPTVVLNMHSAVALTCAAIAGRQPLETGDKERIQAILDALLAHDSPASQRSPRDTISQAYQDPDAPHPLADTPTVIEDYRWQLQLAVLKACEAIGTVPPFDAAQLLQDSRALVRRAAAERVGGALVSC